MKLTEKILSKTAYLQDIYSDVLDLIYVRDSAKLFAKEVAEYLNTMEVLTEEEEYLLEKARKLGGLKIR
jgi:hypothetical protein